MALTPDQVLEQHGPSVFVGGCPVCKHLCCCALHKNSERCGNRYHCYRKCTVVKREERSPQQIMEHPLRWHEANCPCSKDFIDRNLQVQQDDLSVRETKAEETPDRFSPLGHRKSVKRSAHLFILTVALIHSQAVPAESGLLRPCFPRFALSSATPPRWSTSL